MKRIQVLVGDTNMQQVVRNICLSGEQQEAFYVLDVGDIVRKHQEWKVKLPRVETYYAVKCNDSQIVLKVLAALGTGFDCASKGEIEMVMDLGVDASRIIFANSTKPASHIRHAARKGVQVLTFDNEAELHKIKELHPSARLLIRIRCDAKVSITKLGAKFGCDAISEAPRLLEVARALDLNVMGVCFHVGSGCGEPPVFQRAIASARDLFDLGRDLGLDMDVLDIGGGFPGDKRTPIDEIAKIVNKALDDYFPSPEVHVIAEPGRFYVASAYTLATLIHSKREIRSDNSQELEHVMYYIDDGIHGSFNHSSYKQVHSMPAALEEGSGGKVPSSVWGPTCDGLDQVNDNVLLPLMSVGDWIIYEDMGAYSLSIASTFNGFPVSKVHTVVDESVWKTMKDILQLSENHFVFGNAPSTLRIGLGDEKAENGDRKMQTCCYNGSSGEKELSKINVKQ